MVFSSSLFLLYFFPAFLILYYFSGKKLKNITALIASIFFYAWGAPDFIFVVFTSIIIDFYLVKKLYNSDSRKIRRILLSLSVILNIGLLAYFKYANFFIENVNEICSYFGYSGISWLNIALPIGISFFSFQKVTYSVDVYRKVHKPLKKLSDYALYILMFPQLIAGPIVRYNEIAVQIEDRSANENIDNRLTGFFRFILGLSKKVLIANVLGKEVDQIFALSEVELTSYLAWMGVIAYTFQIYFDFSGYSDMAIGIGRMIGFKFPENFNNPYISQSITEFWRRWHITLGRWMKDYLYIPLGGNKVSPKRLYFNLWIVFLISGLWHGAAWNFIIWGAFHGFFLVADRLFLLKVYSKIGKFSSIAITFFITMIGWVLFRAENLHESGIFLTKMFSFDFSPTSYFLNEKFFMILFIAIFFSFWGVFKRIEIFQDRLFFSGKKDVSIILMSGFAIIFLIINLASITSSDFNPFIYFRF